MQQKKRIGEILIEAGMINSEQLYTALDIQKESGGRLGSILVRMGVITEQEMAKFIEQQLDISCYSLEGICPTATALSMINPYTARKFRIFPIRLEGKTLVLAAVYPTDRRTFEGLGFVLGVKIKPLLVLESEVLRAIEIHYGNGDGSPAEDSGPNGVSQSSEYSQYGLYSGTDAAREAVFSAAIALLIAKGFFTKEELDQKIRNIPGGKFQPELCDLFEI
jgi:type IV pilus assembly protein PilB